MKSHLALLIACILFAGCATTTPTLSSPSVAPPPAHSSTTVTSGPELPPLMAGDDIVCMKAGDSERVTTGTSAHMVSGIQLLQHRLNNGERRTAFKWEMEKRDCPEFRAVVSGTFQATTDYYLEQGRITCFDAVTPTTAKAYYLYATKFTPLSAPGSILQCFRTQFQIEAAPPTPPAPPPPPTSP